jgi:hypothetical protein
MSKYFGFNVVSLLSEGQSRPAVGCRCHVKEQHVRQPDKNMNDREVMAFQAFARMQRECSN